MNLNSLKYLRSLYNSSRCFFIFTSFITNSYGGSFKISLPYQFIRGFNSTGGSLKTFSSWRHIYPNPFFENKLYAIRLLIINLIGEGGA